MTRRTSHLINAWLTLHKDFYSGKYIPMNESDVQSYLFHLLVRERSKDGARIDVHTEIKDQDGHPADIIYGEDRYHRLVVEIKMTRLLENMDVRKKTERKIREDLKKCCKRSSNRRHHVLLFCYAGIKNREITPCTLSKTDFRRANINLKRLKRKLESEFKGSVVLLPHLEFGVE